jgi:hypothetical protein
LSRWAESQDPKNPREMALYKEKQKSPRAVKMARGLRRKIP